MQVKRPITVIALVTEAFKQQLITDIEESIQQVNNNIETLDAQARRYLFQLQTADPAQMNAFRRQIDAEKARVEGMKSELQGRLNEAQQLEIGSEFPRGTLDSYVDINVGDNLVDRLGRAEVVIKDDIIIEFRSI